MAGMEVVQNVRSVGKRIGYLTVTECFTLILFTAVLQATLPVAVISLAFDLIFRIDLLADVRWRMWLPFPVALRSQTVVLDSQHQHAQSFRTSLCYHILCCRALLSQKWDCHNSRCRLAKTGHTESTCFFESNIPACAQDMPRFSFLVTRIRLRQGLPAYLSLLSKLLAVHAALFSRDRALTAIIKFSHSQSLATPLLSPNTPEESPLDLCPNCTYIASMLECPRNQVH